MAGFTTVQSVGSPADVPLRDAIAKGLLPGPRILTAIEPIMGRGDQTGTPDEILRLRAETKSGRRGPDQILRIRRDDPRPDDDVSEELKCLR